MAQLAAVRAQIATLTSRLGSQLKQRDVQSARLREADLGIAAKRERLESLRSASSVAQRRREQLLVESTHNQHALEAEQAALASQVRSAYLMGPRQPIKLLLNQSDPASAGRMLAYYGYFAHERTVRIDAVRGDVVRLRALVDDIGRATAKLKTLQSEAAREVDALQFARQERTDALATLTRQLSSGNAQLEILKHQEQAEESLVADLSRVFQDFPSDTQQSFDTLRGNLPWPVPGRVTVRYQESRASAVQSVRWNGVLIEAARGAKVRAPYFGRVVYADWLQGLGLLLIIGHSGNYMTLYGHAEVLYKTVGDWVAPGDVIAALADLGSVAPQLYFEIRDGRKTVDPKSWLKPIP